MIICADYHPSTSICPDDCKFAKNTRRYMYSKAYDNYVNVNKLYGSDICPLKKKAEPSYVSQEDVNCINVNYILEDHNPLDKLIKELKKIQDDIITKILNACGLNVEYVKQHPEEFILQERIVPGAYSHINSITHYILSHNGETIGEWSINTYLDLDGYTVKNIITYNTL